MKLQKNQIIGFLGMIFIAALGIYFFTEDDGVPDGYIISDKSAVTIDDVKATFKRIDFEDRNNSDIFSDDVVNRYTFKYFKFLQKKFQKSKTLDEHINQVRNYLFSTMEPEEAEKLFRLYKAFLMYEKKLAEKLKSWGRPSNTGDSLRTLAKIHEFQKETFGEDIAVKFFGANIKAKEYPIRRSAIANDSSLYGAEKEKKIKELNDDMWGNENSSPSEARRPYDKYREKMQIYSRDLSELEGEEREARIKEFRKEYFSPEVQERLEKVDQLLVEQKAAETTYRQKESEVTGNPNLTEEEKQNKLKELQNEIFGNEADSFRRRENIRRALQP